MKPMYATAFLVIFVVTVQSTALGQDVELKKASIGDGVTLHYIEQGRGEPVVFVHGLTGDYSVWQRQVEAFAEEGFRAIAYSRRYNHPNKNAIQPNHSILVEADDLAAFIRKLDLKKAHIVGHSRGAQTALVLALRHPDLVRTVTLAEAPIVGWLASLPGDEAEPGRAQLRRLIGCSGRAREAFAADNDELALRTMIDCISGDGKYDRIPDAVKARMRQNINELKSLITSQNRTRLDRDQVRRLTKPTLLLSGSRTVATAKYTDPELARLLPDRNSKWVVLQGATHTMWVEQPVQSRNAVLRLIRGESQDPAERPSSPDQSTD